MKVIYKQNIEIEFAKELAKLTNDYLSQGKKVAIYLSSGSIVRTYDLFAENFLAITPKSILENLSFEQADERFDNNPDHKNSNQKFIKENAKLLLNLSEFGAEFNFLLEGLDIAETIRKYEDRIAKNFENKDCKNIILCGLGEDSHILGIKPMNSIINNKIDYDKLFAPKQEFSSTYDAKDFSGRITLNFNALNKASDVFVFVSGDSKKAALEKLVSEESISYENNPSLILKSINTKVFTDIV